MRAFRDLILTALVAVLGFTATAEAQIHHYCHVKRAWVDINGNPVPVIPPRRPNQPSISAPAARLPAPSNVVPRTVTPGKRLVGPTGRTEGFVPPNAMPAAGHGPSPRNSLPPSSQPIAKSAPSRNTVPPATVAKKQAQVASSAGSAPVAKRPVQPPNKPQDGNVVPPAPANDDFTNLVGDVTQDNLDQMTDQIQDRDLALLDQVQQAALDGIDDDINNLPDAGDFTDDDRQAIRDAIANGDPDALRDLLGDDVDTAAGQDLVDRAAAIQAINDARVQLAGGNFGGGDLANLINAVQALGLPGAGQQAIMDLIGQIAIDQQVTDWLQGTDPGIGDVPFGQDVPLVMMPGLPDGLMMPLDDGAVMIGTGAPGDGIAMGFGNPFEVAGLPVAMPGAEPEAAAEGPIAAGQIMLANPSTETVNYNLNQEPQQIASENEQTLDGGQTWVVEFDRGGSFGMAKYTLSEGYYYFAATDKGWELYKKTFKTTLDNTGNKFAFNYMIGEEQQTINPGETHDLAGTLPPVLRFDNGSGQETLRRLDTGSYKVAVGEDSKFDIYAAASVSVPTQTQPAPAPAATSVVAKKSVSTKKTVAAQKAGRTLPQGFSLFDPVKALTDTRAARKLPASFSLFRSTADELAAKKTSK